MGSERLPFEKFKLLEILFCSFALAEILDISPDFCMLWLEKGDFSSRLGVFGSFVKDFSWDFSLFLCFERFIEEETVCSIDELTALK